MIDNQQQKQQLTVAICTYNGAKLLPDLLEKLNTIACPLPFEILIIDNNSNDDTPEVIQIFKQKSQVPLRYVLEAEQGIPFARNRAIAESLHNLYMAFIDADELPGVNWLNAAIHGLQDMGAECVGGKISLQLPHQPPWLTKQLTPFLGELDHGDTAFTIIDQQTSVWSGNVAYRTSIFQNGLRFDTRYNRKGKGVGGGSDGIMFKDLLKQKAHILYEPEMHITHLIEPEKIKRSYFLKLHYKAGLKTGLYEYNIETPELLGIPRFMYCQLVIKTKNLLKVVLKNNSCYMREAMNIAHHIGLMQGLFKSYFAHGCSSV